MSSLQNRIGWNLMIIKIQVKNTDDIIGLKEEISSRLEWIVEIIRIDVESEKEKDVDGNYS